MLESFIKLIMFLIKSQAKEIVLIRFLAVGGGFTLVYSLAATLLTMRAGMPPALASPCAYAACLLPSYLAQKNVAFRSLNAHTYSLPRYLALQVVLMLLGTVLSWLLIKALHWPALLSFLLIGPAVAVFSFFAQRYWTFLETEEALKARQSKLQG